MVNIDETEYYTKEELAGEGLEMSQHVVVISDRGWIFEGVTQDPDAEGGIDLTHAHVVRRWTNGLGIGGIQSAEHKGDYTLDALPAGIRVAARAVIAVLPITEW